jgi:hypothetical protein
MGEKRVNPRIVFLLVLLIAIGVFLLYSRLTFTGYVVGEYFSGSTSLSNFSNDSVFNNTKFNGNAVVLDNLTLSRGIYISPFYTVRNETEVIWENFAPTIYSNLYASYVDSFFRACNDNLNCTTAFLPMNSSTILLGKYFQYMVEMRVISGDSPELKGGSISYHTPLNLPISINSPSNSTYYNGTVLLKITANNPSVFYNVTPNVTSNEIYGGEVNKTFNEGTYVLTAWVNDSYGNVNSTSVAFTIGFIKTFYKLENNVCNAVSITTAQKTPNDYTTAAECQSQVTNTTTNTSNTSSTTLNKITEECVPEWIRNEWSECVDGKQTRTCYDAKECEDTTEVCETEEQDCVATEVPEASTETPTPTTTSKGFLGVVGSAIATPFTYVFGNRTRIFIFSGVLLVVIAGFLVFKFSPGVRLRILKLFNVRKRRVSDAD